MKVTAFSDPHGSLPLIREECDLLLIGGDICPVDQSHEVPHQRHWLRTFFSDWLYEQPAKHIAWIAGNHDFACEGSGFWRVAEGIGPDHAHYLCDRAFEVDGIKVWGMPWVPHLPNWAFAASEATIQEKYDMIPDDTDIILSHGPPYGILDAVAIKSWGEHVGAQVGPATLNRIMPKRFICGHIHEGYGKVKLGEILFHNVAHMNRDYEPVNPPIRFKIEAKATMESSRYSLGMIELRRDQRKHPRPYFNG